MVFSVTEFLETPTVEEFELLKKDDLISLGLHFKLAVKSSMRKQEIKVIVVKRLLQEEIFSSYDFPEENVSSETKMSRYEFELEKMKLQLFPLPCGAGSTVPREGFDSSVIMPFSWCVVAVTLPI